MPQARTAIVTAAGHGIGAAIARRLAADGYRLALMSNAGGARALAEALNARGMTGSVANPEDLARLVDETMRAYGRIDALVINTGHPPKGELLEIADQAWHDALDLLLLDAVRLARLVTPIMLKQGGGSILNISGTAAVEPELAFPVSNALRAALSSFCKLYAERYAAAGIRMNNLLPGYVDSYPETRAVLRRIPMQRYATVDEIAAAAAYLLSPEASYITGQNLRIDGGLTRAI
jgi:NAD(P)-dependent dehydrogenase (short-subunit alcohol dehydrogenase family)